MNINKYHQPLFPMSCSLLIATAIAGMRTPGHTITPTIGAIRLLPQWIRAQTTNILKAVLFR